MQVIVVAFNVPVVDHCALYISIALTIHSMCELSRSEMEQSKLPEWDGDWKWVISLRAEGRVEVELRRS